MIAQEKQELREKKRAGNHHRHRYTKERNERAATHTWAPRYVQRRDTRVRFNHEILKSYGSSTPLAARRLTCVFVGTSTHTATVLWAFFPWKGYETLHFVILLRVNGQKETWVPKSHFQHNARAGKCRTAPPRHLKLCGKTQFGSIKTSDEHFALARGAIVLLGKSHMLRPLFRTVIYLSPPDWLLKRFCRVFSALFM